MTEDFLVQRLREQEGLKLEFKREMYDLQVPEAKAEFIKDILSLLNGNTGSSRETAHLIIGAGNSFDSTGNRPLFDVGTIDVIDKQLIEMLNAACDPPIADIRCQNVVVDGTRLFVISIPPSPFLHETTKPLRMRRRTFDKNTVFVRRSETIGVATPQETECIASEKKDLFKSKPGLEVQRSTLKELAIRLRVQQAERKLSAEELWRLTIDAATALTTKTGKDYLSFTITPEVIRNFLTTQSTSMLYAETIEILSEALEVPCNDLLSKHSGNRLFLEPTLDPVASQKIGNLIKTYEVQASQLRAWAEFLPCSLEPPSFMEAHHEAMFAHSMIEERSILIDTFNKIGSRRREWFQSDERKSTCSFTQMMFKSALDAIASGKGDYEGIKPTLREDCLRFLLTTISDSSNRAALIIASDVNAETIKRKLRQIDSLLVFGNLFTMWREHDGSIFYSANEVWIKRHVELLDSLQEHAEARSHEVQASLEHLIRSVA